MDGEIRLNAQKLVLFVHENGKELVLKIDPGATAKHLRNRIVTALERVGSAPASITNTAKPRVTMAGMVEFPFSLAGWDNTVPAARGRIVGVTNGCVSRFIDAGNQCKTQEEYRELRTATVLWLHPAMDATKKPRVLQPYNELAFWNILNKPQRALMISFKKDVLSKLPVA